MVTFLVGLVWLVFSLAFLAALWSAPEVFVGLVLVLIERYLGRLLVIIRSRVSDFIYSTSGSTAVGVSGPASD